MGKPLETKTEITEYMRCGWRRIEVLITFHGFPAKKIAGNWTSHTDVIEEWRKNMLSNSSMVRKR